MKMPDMKMPLSITPPDETAPDIVVSGKYVDEEPGSLTFKISTTQAEMTKIKMALAGEGSYLGLTLPRDEEEPPASSAGEVGTAGKAKWWGAGLKRAALRQEARTKANRDAIRAELLTHLSGLQEEKRQMMQFLVAERELQRLARGGVERGGDGGVDGSGGDGSKPSTPTTSCASLLDEEANGDNPVLALASEPTLRHVLGFLEGDEFLFLGSVCKLWRRTYRRLYGSSTSFKQAVLTLYRLSYAEECHLPLTGTQGEKLFSAAVRERDLVTARALREMGCAWSGALSSRSCVMNKAQGKPILEWLYSLGIDTDGATPAWWMSSLLLTSAVAGRLDILQWATQGEVRQAYQEAFDDHSLYSEVLTCACERGHFDVLEWLCGHGSVPDDLWRGAVKSAAGSGQHTVIYWLRRHASERCVFDAQCCAAAVAGGHRRCFEVLRSSQIKCPMDKWSCPVYVQAQNPPDGETRLASQWEASARLEDWIQAGHKCHLCPAPPTPPRASISSSRSSSKSILSDSPLDWAKGMLPKKAKDMLSEGLFVD